MLIEKKYKELCETESNINEHLPTLKRYTEECDSVVELGVCTIVSTWAFLAGNPKKLTSIDIKHPSVDGGNLPEVEEAAKENNIDFSFILGDSRVVEIPTCDLLFIDTNHIYDVLKVELSKHGNKASKYIILHDTQTFGEIGEDPRFKGLNYAISEFLSENKNWKVKEVFTNNNGLTVLERV